MRRATGRRNLALRGFERAPRRRIVALRDREQCSHAQGVDPLRHRGLCAQGRELGESIGGRTHLPVTQQRLGFAQARGQDVDQSLRLYGGATARREGLGRFLEAGELEQVATGFERDRRVDASSAQ